MEKTHFYGTTDKNALDYKINEPVTFTVYPIDNKKITERQDIVYYKWEITADDGREESGSMCVRNNLVPLILTTRLSRPGFIRVVVEACDKNKTPLPDIVRFEGGAGVDVHNIKSSTLIPDDFDNFWCTVKNDVDSVDISEAEIIRIEVGGYKDNWKLEYGRIRGWAPDYALGLCYFDTAVQAKKVKCPVKITARLGDYTCPPSGIMALYNNLNTKAEITFQQNGTHGYESPDCEIYTLKKGC